MATYNYANNQNAAVQNTRTQGSQVRSQPQNNSSMPNTMDNHAESRGMQNDTMQQPQNLMQSQMTNQMKERVAGQQESQMMNPKMQDHSMMQMQSRPTTRGTNAMPRGTSIMPPMSADTPTTVQSPYYTAGFLREFIGHEVRVEFLMGTSGALIDRTGTLMEVGASYIVIQPTQTDDLLMCDLFSIKFVTIYM